MFDMCQIVFIPFSIETIQPALQSQGIPPFGAFGTTFPQKGALSYGPIICI